MDDKNNEIIDFSNQPLGLMAQEGARIEEKNNNEYRLNEAARNIGNQQVNPFENIELQSKGNNKFFGNVNNIQNNQVPQFNQNMNNQMNMPVQNMPSNQIGMQVSSMPNTQINQGMQMTPMNQNVLSNQINQSIPDNHVQNSTDIGQPMNTNNSPSNKEVINNNEEQPGSWGLIVFIIFILIAGGAIYLFNSGKLDSLLNDEKEAKTVEKTNNENDIKEESNQANVVETINNFGLKETIYISVDKVNTYITAQGVIDLTNNTGKFSENVSVNGIISRNTNYYIDYATKLFYTQDVKNSNKWIKEKIFESFKYNIDARIEELENAYSFKEVSPNNYKLEIPGSYYESLYSNPENIPKSINTKGTIVLEYTKKDGHVIKTRYDLTNIVKDVNKYYIVQEISNINGNEEVIIPESILNTK